MRCSEVVCRDVKPSTVVCWRDVMWNDVEE